MGYNFVYDTILEMIDAESGLDDKMYLLDELTRWIDYLKMDVEREWEELMDKHREEDVGSR